MIWNEHTQQRFASLRQRALTASLSDDEQRELDALIAAISEEEAQYLEPALDRMDNDLRRREEELAALQVRNEEIASLARQHEQLLSEAKAWLDSFEQRRLVLQDRYARLTTEPPPSGSRR
jgi:DNA repair ATPase RecN